MVAMQRQQVENSASQAKKDKDRDTRTDRLAKSICVGCGGDVLPFNPSGVSVKKA